MAVQDAPEKVWVLDAERSMEQVIEEEQADRAQVASLSQMQLLAMVRVEAQEKELQRLSALLVEHHVLKNLCLKGPTMNLSKLNLET